MSWFTPVRKVTDPDGRSWEVYAFRMQVPSWRDGDAAGLGDPWESPVGGLFFVPWLLAQIPLFLFHHVLVPAVRFVLALPRAAVGSRRTTTWTVEAVSFFPAEDRYAWTTTSDHRRRVVDQVATGLEQGEIARPLGAAFHGSPR